MGFTERIITLKCLKKIELLGLLTRFSLQQLQSKTLFRKIRKVFFGWFFR